MFVLQNICQDRVWGSPRMKEYGADNDTTGSVYSVSATKEIDCGYSDPQSKESGKLFELSQSNPQKLGLKAGEVYPLIIDMLGADKDLSIQVHPQDEFARKQGFDYGKMESWYFLESPTSGSVYGGIKNDKISSLTDTALASAPLDYIDTVPSETGDYLFVPNGTVHAIRAGSLVYEIQQSTDITYRIFDYGRKGLDGKPRQLHVKEALENLKPENKVIKRDFKSKKHVEELAYSLDLIDPDGDTLINNSSDIAAVFTLFKGNLEINGVTISKGNSIMLMPHEKVNARGSGEGILASPTKYWRK